MVTSRWVQPFFVSVARGSSKDSFNFGCQQLELSDRLLFGRSRIDVLLSSCDSELCHSASSIFRFPVPPDVVVLCFPAAFWEFMMRSAGTSAYWIRVSFATKLSTILVNGEKISPFPSAKIRACKNVNHRIVALTSIVKYDLEDR